MKRLIKFNEIGEFSRVVSKLNKHVKYNNGYMPKLEVVFTEKIHGTNAAVCYNDIDGFWVQSRERILSLESDNAGCAFTAESLKDDWMAIIHELADYYNIDLHTKTISIYYEWCGGSIQKKSAVSGLDKRSIIFQHFKVSPLNAKLGEDGEVLKTDDQPAEWLETCKGNKYVDNVSKNSFNVMNYKYVDNVDKNIFNVMNYKTWKILVDFKSPKLFQNDFLELVSEVEKCSPIGKAMGQPENIGEGVVGTFLYDDILYKFKVKGEKHTSTKVKVLKPVDTEREKAKVALATKVATASRFEQGWQAIFGIDNEIKEPCKESMGDFLRWVFRDIMKEHLDDYAAAGIEPKEINSLINNIARPWFLEQVDNYLMGENI